MINYDYFASTRIQNKEDVGNLINKKNQFETIDDFLTKSLLLNTVFGIDHFDEQIWRDSRGRENKITPKDFVKVGEGKGNESGLLKLLHTNKTETRKIIISWNSILNNLELFSPKIGYLPEGSCYLKIPITLKTPFISNDDIPFYIIDNPIKKDKIFSIPFISPSTWKGNLRWVMNKINLEEKISDPNLFLQNRFDLTLLFGTEKGFLENKGLTEYLDGLLVNDGRDKYNKEYRKKLIHNFGESEPSIKGMIYFYPTFWNDIDLDVINPHDRETKTGKNPIYYEVVPAGASGEFRLLYIPIHHMGLHENENEFINKITEDLEKILKGVEQMMLKYGVGAKTSSGNGIMELSLGRSKFLLNFSGIELKEQENEIEEPPDDFLKYLTDDGSVKDEFKGSGESGLLSNNEFKAIAGQNNVGSLTKFKSFRRWYGKNGEKRRIKIQEKNSPSQKVLNCFFSNFEELKDIIDNLQNSGVEEK